MAWRILFRPEVEADVSQAVEWYDSHQPGLGAEFREEIISAFDTLADNSRTVGILARTLARPEALSLSSGLPSDRA